MNIDHMGALVCRGVGLLLLVLGGSALLPTLFFGLRPGWTYYAPIGGDQPTWLLSLLFFLRSSLPAIAQLLVGVALLVFSRFFGHLLASGLSTPVT